MFQNGVIVFARMTSISQQMVYGMSLNDFVPGEGLDDNVCPVEEADWLL